MTTLRWGLRFAAGEGDCHGHRGRSGQLWASRACQLRFLKDELRGRNSCPVWFCSFHLDDFSLFVFCHLFLLQDLWAVQTCSGLAELRLSTRRLWSPNPAVSSLPSAHPTTAVSGTTCSTGTSGGVNLLKGGIWV